MAAAGAGGEACVQELLEAGARVDLPNDDGLTALTLADCQS